MKKLISEAVGLGVPVLALACTMKSTGQRGAPAFNCALGKIGGGSMYVGALALWGLNIGARRLAECVIDGVEAYQLQKCLEEGGVQSPQRIKTEVPQKQLDNPCSESEEIPETV